MACCVRSIDCTGFIWMVGVYVTKWFCKQVITSFRCEKRLVNGRSQRRGQSNRHETLSATQLGSTSLGGKPETACSSFNPPLDAVTKS